MQSITRKLLFTAFTCYFFVIAALTIIPTHLTRLRSTQADHVNLIPLGYSFNCIRLAHRRHPDLMTFCLRNTLGNVALFLPLGILLPLTFDRFRSLKQVLAIAFCLSLSIETIQFFSRFIGSARAVDIDDVLLNTLGACLGFLLFRIFQQGEGEPDNRGTGEKGKG
jgi:glycopeptide antibiotics resistance protein